MTPALVLVAAAATAIGTVPTAWSPLAGLRRAQPTTEGESGLAHKPAAPLGEAEQAPHEPPPPPFGSTAAVPGSGTSPSLGGSPPWPAPPQSPVDAPGTPAPQPAGTGDPLGAGASGDPAPFRRRLAVAPHFVYRLGNAGRAVSPAAGYGLAGTIEVDYVRAASVLEGAVGVDFSFDRFATAERAMVIVDGEVQTFSSTRVISETSFVLVHTAAARLGRVRPFFNLGVGMGLGYFDSLDAALHPGTATDVHLLGRAAVGADVALARTWGLMVRADYTAVRGASTLRTTDGRTLDLFGDLLAIGAGIAYRF